MSAMRRRIDCDFVAQGRPPTALGISLLVLGVIFVAIVAAAYVTLYDHLSEHEHDLASLRQRQRSVLSSEDIRPSQDVLLAEEDLATPWTLLLAELEKASKDSAEQVAVLAIAPDHAKHSVLITGEARSLPLALAYVKRLQASRSIQFPMLDRHELRADDPQHPVRFDIIGQWRDQP